MPSFEKIHPDKKNKSHKKEIGQHKAAASSSAEKKGIHSPSFFIPALSAVLTILLFLAGSALVLPRSRSVFESPAVESAGSGSMQDSPSDTASPEGIRAWLGVDTVLEVLTRESSGPSQPSASPVPSREEDASSAPVLSSSPAGEVPVSAFSSGSTASSAAETESAAAKATRMTAAADSTGKPAADQTASVKENISADHKSQTGKAAESSGKETPAAQDGKQDQNDNNNKDGKEDQNDNKNKNGKEKKDSSKDRDGKGDRDAGNKEQDPDSKNTRNDKGDSDSDRPLTKKQKEYVRAWEELHGYDFPMQTTLHDYNWDYLEYDEQWNLYYKGDKKYRIRRGIDVSEFQGVIDWDEVKKNGYDFVFVRAGHRMFESGDLLTDQRAVKNMKQAKKAGLDVGVYVFSQAVSEKEAQEEAQLCLDIIEKSGVEITLPVVFDPEIQTEYIARINYISGEQFTDNAVAFCEKIEKAGFTPAIYTNCSTETDILDMSRLDDAVIWYADYGIIPESPYRFTFWQYSNTGWVEGIPEGMTDLNVWFVEREEK